MHLFQAKHLFSTSEDASTLSPSCMQTRFDCSNNFSAKRKKISTANDPRESAGAAQVREGASRISFCVSEAVPRTRGAGARHLYKSSELQAEKKQNTRTTLRAKYNLCLLSIL